jgi:hypothetical protein
MSFIENPAFCASNACPERPRRVPRGEASRKAGYRKSDGKRSDGQGPKPPRSSSTYMRAPLSRGISVAFSDLDSLLVTDLGARSSPAAAKRCAKGAGLEGAPKSVTSSKRSPNILCCSSLFELRSDPRRALCVRAALAAPTYIRPGYNPSQGPSCALRGRGLQGGWDHSLPRHLSAMSRSSHTSTLDS